VPTTVPALAQSVKPSRKPLAPVQVVGRFVGGASRQDVIDGAAVLSIVSGDATDRDETAYWCRANFTGGVCIGFTLTKFATGEVYDLPRDLSSCDCPDQTYKGERPGGCKHMAALRQALPTVTGTAPPTPRRPDRKTERDEITSAEACNS
jgi:hypothetical protein